MKPSLILRNESIRKALLFLCPKLYLWPVDQWPEVIEKAKQIDFDFVERVGMMLGIIWVTWLLGPTAQLENQSLSWIYGTQFLMSLPLLLVFVGPFFLRRLRRGLEREYRQAMLAGKR